MFIKTPFLWNSKTAATETTVALFIALALSSANAQELKFSDQIDLSTELIKEQIESLDLSPSIKQTLKDSVRLNPRIVGGHIVKINDVPWQVALLRGKHPEPYRFQFCGGSLIKPNWVLTAAHCVDSRIVQLDPSNVDILAGTGNFSSGGERISVEEIITHPKWDKSTLDNDFALIRLSSNSTLGEAISIANKEWNAAPDLSLLVTGWGAIFEGGNGSEKLLGANVPFINNNTCNTPESYNGSITENMMCAGKRDGGVDACQGDSGGPLVSQADAQNILVGVVSWGEGCARELKYGVYSRVSRAADWIISKVGS